MISGKKVVYGQEKNSFPNSESDFAMKVLPFAFLFMPNSFSHRWNAAGAEAMETKLTDVHHCKRAAAAWTISEKPYPNYMKQSHKRLPYEQTLTKGAVSHHIE